MKKVYVYLLGILCAAACLFLPVSAVGESLEAVRGTPQVDGVAESVWNVVQPQPFLHVVDGVFSGDDERPGSCRGSVSALWDEEALYFLIELKDNDFTGADGREAQNADLLHMYIDEADYYGATWRDGQVHLTVQPEPDGWVTVHRGTLSPETVFACTAPDSTSRVIEIRYVPQSFQPAREQQILVDFRLDDYTPEGGLSYSLTWSDELNEGEQDSSSWSYMYLLEKMQRDGGYASAEAAARAIGQPLLTEYRFMEGSDGYDGENADRLWDGDVETKFCTSHTEQYSIAKLPYASRLSGVVMATANDTEMYPRRNPRRWKVEASKDMKKWDTLLTGNENFFVTKNLTYTAQSFDMTETSYRFVRFSNDKTSSTGFQLSEIAVCGVRANMTQEEIDALLHPHPETPEIQADAAAPMPVWTGREPIAEPAEPDAAGPSYTATAMVLVGISAALLGGCLLIVFLQAKKQKRKTN